MSTIKDLEKQLKGLAQDKGLDITIVFVDLLDYIIGFLNPLQTESSGQASKYSKDDNVKFNMMMRTYFELMLNESEKNGWYDAWGDLFMEIHVRGNNMAQFFTPPALCNIMAENSLADYHGEEPKTNTTFGKRIVVNDCSCGSSRNLLAVKAIFEKNGWKPPYLVGEDLDLTCCKMSAVNMAMHGCFGEVVCHDTLIEPDKVRYGYIINETMYPFPSGIPSIRPCCDESRFFTVSTRRHSMPPVKTKKEPIQLSLF